MIFFTSDTHYGHANIIKYCNRPFASIEEMDSSLIANHNSVVSENDTVYHIGDFAFGNLYAIERYFSKLNGRIRVVPGGHDKWINDAKKFVTRSGYKVEILPPLYSLEIGGLIVVLCHYALRVWDRSHYSSIHLYGHSHGNLPPIGRSIDVGVDCNNFYPFSLADIERRLANEQNDKSTSRTTI